MKYRRDIDGLRALAILPVIMYHANLGCPGGFVGVDVFFVISGFLITAILRNSISQGKFCYKEFWSKRVLRLVPALTIVTLTVGFLAKWILLPEDLFDLGGALVAQPLLMSNLYFWRVVKGGYFGDPPETRPLLHTWSLGVEEQFYLFYPLMLMWASRKGSRFLAVIGCLGIFVSLWSCIALTPQRSVFAFFNLPTRAWEFLVGAGACYLPQRAMSRGLRDALGAVGILLILGSVYLFDHSTPFPGTAAIWPCLGTTLALYVYGLPGESPATRRILESSAFVTIGKISYSIYLWHWPIFALGAYVGLLVTITSKLLALLLTFVLGYISWRGIEQPFRNLRSKSNQSLAVGTFLLYLTTTASLGVYFCLNRGFPNSWSTRALSFANARHDKSHLFELKLEPPPAPSALKSLGKGGDRPSFILWGDSHAMAHAPLLDTLGKELHRRGLQITCSSTAPLLGPTSRLSPAKQLAWEQVLLDAIRYSQRPQVYLAALWSSYPASETKKRLRTTVQRLNAIGVEPIFILDVPYHPVDIPRSLALNDKHPQISVNRVSPIAYQTELQSFRAILSQTPGRFETLDPTRLFIEAEMSIIEHKGISLYRDNNHLSTQGSLYLRPLFVPSLSDSPEPH